MWSSSSTTTTVPCPPACSIARAAQPATARVAGRQEAVHAGARSWAGGDRLPRQYCWVDRAHLLAESRPPTERRRGPTVATPTAAERAPGSFGGPRWLSGTLRSRGGRPRRRGEAALALQGGPRPLDSTGRRGRPVRGGRGGLPFGADRRGPLRRFARADLIAARGRWTCRSCARTSPCRRPTSATPADGGRRRTLHRGRPQPTDELAEFLGAGRLGPALDALVEVHDEVRAEPGRSAPARRWWGVNQRDLSTFEVEPTGPPGWPADPGSEVVAVAETGIVAPPTPAARRLRIPGGAGGGVAGAAGDQAAAAAALSGHPVGPRAEAARRRPRALAAEATRRERARSPRSDRRPAVSPPGDLVVKICG